MSRNASGTYSLPAGNPVVPSTTITSSWANTTLSDIATALTDSLDRNGKGEMNAALKIVAGSAGTPGLSFATDTDTGIYRVAANQLGIAAGGAAAAFFSAAQVNIAGRLVLNLNSTFDLFTNTEAMTTIIGDATMSSPVSVASGNTLRVTGVYYPVELDSSTAIGFYQSLDSGGSGAGGSLYGIAQDIVHSNASGVTVVYGARFNVNMSSGAGGSTAYGLYVDVTNPTGGVLNGAVVYGNIDAAPAGTAIYGVRFGSADTDGWLSYGLFADESLKLTGDFVYRKQGPTETGGFLKLLANGGTTLFSVDINGTISNSVTGAQAASLASSLTGAPATSTGTDANRAFRLYNTVAELAAGIYASTQGVWIQVRDDGNYATNLPLSLQPNGSKVVVGTASATNVSNSQVLDVWSGSIRAQGSSLSISGGVGAEMDYTGGRGRFFCYDRAGAAWAGVDIIGLTIQLQANGVLQATVDTSGINLASTKVLRVNSTQVVTARQTGWTAATGSATRSTFATTTVTTQQLAERVKALIDDLITHGLIGA